ncbi:hypothetical protein Ahy_B03g061795 [Arachis hypogaea]|uniref:Uncharacterized protein n=1 Tax=Arachis hypogaea TaxID=3818 RepID=A0A444ZSB2_ARAHY|nr:hypothetical protein Ahy_B03g061795 [Arachis hypogaea]
MDNDVCVKMLCAPLKPSDINRIQGVYPVSPEPPTVGVRRRWGELPHHYLQPLLSSFPNLKYLHRGSFRAWVVGDGGSGCCMKFPIASFG